MLKLFKLPGKHAIAVKQHYTGSGLEVTVCHDDVREGIEALYNGNVIEPTFYVGAENLDANDAFIEKFKTSLAQSPLEHRIETVEVARESQDHPDNPAYSQTVTGFTEIVSFPCAKEEEAGGTFNKVCGIVDNLCKAQFSSAHQKTERGKFSNEQSR